MKIILNAVSTQTAIFKYTSSVW